MTEAAGRARSIHFLDALVSGTAQAVVQLAGAVVLDGSVALTDP